MMLVKALNVMEVEGRLDVVVKVVVYGGSGGGSDSAGRSWIVKVGTKQRAVYVEVWEIAKEKAHSL